MPVTQSGDITSLSDLGLGVTQQKGVAISCTPKLALCCNDSRKKQKLISVGTSDERKGLSRVFFFDVWRAATNHCCGPVTVPIPIYCFTSFPSFVMDCLFVNSLVRSVGGWGLLFFCQKYLDMAFKHSIVSTFLLYDFFSYSYFHYLLFVCLFFLIHCGITIWQPWKQCSIIHLPMGTPFLDKLLLYKSW